VNLADPISSMISVILEDFVPFAVDGPEEVETDVVAGAGSGLGIVLYGTWVP